MILIVSTRHHLLFPTVGRQALPVAGPLDDYLVSGVGETIQGAVAKDRIIKQPKPFVNRPVAGKDEAGFPVTSDNEFVKISRLLGGQFLQAEVVEYKQVGRQVGAESLFKGMIDS